MQSWNTFEDSSEQLPFQNILKSSSQDALYQPSTSDQFLSVSVPEVALSLLLL